MKLRLAALAAAFLLAITPASAETTTLRFGYPGVGADNRLFASGDVVVVARAGHFIDDEFARDPDIKIEWTSFRGARPALNESPAAGHLDVAVGLGDLPSLLGRANGLQTRFLVTDNASSSPTTLPRHRQHFRVTDKVRDTIYLAVQPDSGINRLVDPVIDSDRLL